MTETVNSGGYEIKYPSASWAFNPITVSVKAYSRLVMPLADGTYNNWPVNANSGLIVSGQPNYMSMEYSFTAGAYDTLHAQQFRSPSGQTLGIAFYTSSAGSYISGVYNESTANILNGSWAEIPIPSNAGSVLVSYFTASAAPAASPPQGVILYNTSEYDNSAVPESLELTLSDEDGTADVVIHRDTYQGAAVFNMSGGARAFFDRAEIYGYGAAYGPDNILRKYINWNLSAIASDGTSVTVLSTFLTCDWGALQPGESEYHNSKRFVYFNSYPFTYPHMVTPGDEYDIYIREDEGAYEYIGRRTGGKYNTEVPANTAADKIIIRANPVQDGGGLWEGPFTREFDHTFRGISPGTVFLELIVSCDAGDGTYLRWLDRYGFWNYYLFRTLGEFKTIANSDVVFSEHMLTTCYTDELTFGVMYNAGTGQPTGKEATEGLLLGASGLEPDIYEYVSRCVESPVVDWFKGWDDNGLPMWLRVTLEPGTFERGREALSDFTCTMNKNPIQLPHL